MYPLCTCMGPRNPTKKEEPMLGDSHSFQRRLFFLSSKWGEVRLGTLEDDSGDI